MKIRPEHFEYIKQRIVPRDTPERRENYRNGQFYNSDKVHDLYTRYRWDLMNESVDVRWICDQLYDYMNDTHIDTALKKIIPPI